MGTTSENITLLKRRLSTFSEEELLAGLDEVVQMVYGSGGEAVYYIDPSTGMPPFIETVDTQYEYDCPDDCAEVVSVFLEWQRDTSSYYGDRTFYDTYRWQNKEYCKASVDVRPKTPADLAKVIWRHNPGNTTDKYYLLYRMEHPTLEDTTVEIRIPSRLHYLLRRGVQLILSPEEYGEAANTDRELDNIIKRVRNEMNKGSTIRRVGRTNPQPEHRTYGYGRRGKQF